MATIIIRTRDVHFLEHRWTIAMTANTMVVAGVLLGGCYSVAMVLVGGCYVVVKVFLVGCLLFITANHSHEVLLHNTRQLL